MTLSEFKKIIKTNKSNIKFKKILKDAFKKFNIKSFKNLNSKNISEFLKYIEENIELNEISNTAFIDGYLTPFAFSSSKQKPEEKNAVKYSLKKKWKLVKENVENKIELNPKQQIAYNIKEIRNKIEEIEKILLKSKIFKEKNKLTSDDFYKRTKNNLKQINIKILNIIKYLQEI